MDLRRRIVHADLDTFFVSVERLRDPSLEGRPVIVGGDPNGRGVVTACSYETRVFGVRSGMPARTAARLCPQAIFIQGRHGDYRTFGRRVHNLFVSLVPVVERASIDEFYFDLTGCEPLFGDLQQWCDDTAGRVREELGLPVTFGLATSKLMAKIATNDVKRRRVHERTTTRVGYIEPGTEAHFLAPKPVETLPGVGPSTAERLRSRGYQTLGDIQRAGADNIVKLLGDNGRSLYRRAHGIDTRPVSPDFDPRSIGHERTFREDVDDLDVILKRLRHLAEQTASDLRKKSKLATRIILKWRYSDFETVTRSTTVKPTNEALVLYRTIEPHAKKLMTTRAVRLIGVRAEGLTESGIQTTLDDPQPERRQTLLRTVDELRARFGDDIILPGSLK